jgi:hypothetical protein
MVGTGAGVPAEMDVDEAVVEVVGQCADFCDMPGATQAAPIEVHSAWCRSRPCGREIRANTDAGRVDITVELTRPYRNGRYRRVDAHQEQDVCVRVTFEPAPANAESTPMSAYLSSGASRQFAATLIRAADQADRLDDRLNDAWLAREQRRHEAV